MAAVEAVLAAVGLLALIAGAAIIFAPDSLKPPSLKERDPALPYMEALAAALRIQQAGAAAEADLEAESAQTMPPAFDPEKHDDA